MPSEHHRARLIAIKQYRWFTVQTDVPLTANTHLQDSDLRGVGWGRGLELEGQDSADGGLQKLGGRKDCPIASWIQIMSRESADAPFGIIFKKKIKGRSATGEGKGDGVKWGLQRSSSHGSLSSSVNRKLAVSLIGLGTGNSSNLGVRNECQNVSLVKSWKLQSHYGIICLSTDDKVNHPRYKQGPAIIANCGCTDLPVSECWSDIMLVSLKNIPMNATLCGKDLKVGGRVIRSDRVSVNIWSSSRRTNSCPHVGGHRCKLLPSAVVRGGVS